MDDEKKERIEEELLMEWTVHLFKSEKRYRSVLALLAVITAAVGGFLFIGNVVVGCIYIAILYFTLGDFFFPVKYRITDKGVYALSLTGPRFMSWDRIKKAYKNERGVKLSIFEYPSPFESFRGLFIRTTDRRDEVIGLLKKMIHGPSVQPHAGGGEES